MRLCKGNVTHGKRGGSYMTTASGRKVSCRPSRSTWYGGMFKLDRSGARTFRMMVKVSARKPVEYALVSSKGTVYVHKKVLSKTTSDALKQRILAGGRQWRPLDVFSKKLTKTRPRFFGSLAGIKKTAPKKKAVAPKKKAVTPKKKKAVAPKKKAVAPKKKAVAPKKKVSWVGHAYDSGVDMEYAVFKIVNDRVVQLWHSNETDYNGDQKFNEIKLTPSFRESFWEKVDEYMGDYSANTLDFRPKIVGAPKSYKDYGFILKKTQMV